MKTETNLETADRVGGPVGREIADMLRRGIDIDDIVTTDGNPDWGDLCATTREDAQASVDHWNETDSNRASATVEDLQTGEAWLETHRND